MKLTIREAKDLASYLENRATHAAACGQTPCTCSAAKAKEMIAKLGEIFKVAYELLPEGSTAFIWVDASLRYPH